MTDISSGDKVTIRQLPRSTPRNQNKPTLNTDKGWLASDLEKGERIYIEDDEGKIILRTSPIVTVDSKDLNGKGAKVHTLNFIWNIYGDTND